MKNKDNIEQLFWNFSKHNIKVILFIVINLVFIGAILFIYTIGNIRYTALQHSIDTLNKNKKDMILEINSIKVEFMKNYNIQEMEKLYKKKKPINNNKDSNFVNLKIPAENIKKK